MLYFRQIFSFQSEFSKDKTATWLPLPPVVFLSPPTFWETRDQPEPRSFFPCSLRGEKTKGPGKEVKKTSHENMSISPLFQLAYVVQYGRSILYLDQGDEWLSVYEHYRMIKNYLFQVRVICKTSNEIIFTLF